MQLLLTQCISRANFKGSFDSWYAFILVCFLVNIHGSFCPFVFCKSLTTSSVLTWLESIFSVQWICNGYTGLVWYKNVTDGMSTSENVVWKNPLVSLWFFYENAVLSILHQMFAISLFSLPLKCTARRSSRPLYEAFDCLLTAREYILCIKGALKFLQDIVDARVTFNVILSRK